MFSALHNPIGRQNINDAQIVYSAQIPVLLIRSLQATLILVKNEILPVTCRVFI